MDLSLRDKTNVFFSVMPQNLWEGVECMGSKESIFGVLKVRIGACLERG